MSALSSQGISQLCFLPYKTTQHTWILGKLLLMGSLGGEERQESLDSLPWRPPLPPHCLQLVEVLMAGE